MQRRHAIALRGVDVGAVAEQRAHGVDVAAHRRVGDGDLDVAHGRGADGSPSVGTPPATISSAMTTDELYASGNGYAAGLMPRVALDFSTVALRDRQSLAP